MADDDAIITITADVTSIDLNESVTIRILGYNSDGSLLWDGTRIDLTIENGTLNMTTVELEDGRATVVATADKERGEMNITARSGTSMAEPNPLVIAIGSSAEVSQIIANMNPTELPSSGGQVQIVIRVYDSTLQPIPDTSVVLETTAGTLSSNGTPLITNDQGTVVDYLQTTTSATVTIYAGSLSKSLEITVPDEPENEPPVAEFNYSPSDPNSNETIYFNASESTDPDGGEIVRYKWDFGDGSSASGQKVTHVYDLQSLPYKSFVVTLTVTDDKGATNSTSRDVYVSTKPVG